jgi:hypothetical protein
VGRGTTATAVVEGPAAAFEGPSTIRLRRTVPLPIPHSRDREELELALVV